MADQDISAELRRIARMAPTFAPHMMAAADEIDRLRGGWIACSERLPDPETRVLAVANHETVIAHWTGEDWIAVDPGGTAGNFYIYPTAWRPLPPAPEGRA